MGRSIASSRPSFRHTERLGIAGCLFLACAAATRIPTESTTIPGQEVTEQELAAQLASSDLVFAGRVVDYYRWPPAVEPHAEYFAPVTYRILRVFKGPELADSSTVVVYQLARWPSPLVDSGLRLEPSVFGQGRTLVVFARHEGSHLHAREGVVAATRDVVQFLEEAAAPR
jgi:hypothetical protein